MSRRHVRLWAGAAACLFVGVLAWQDRLPSRRVSAGTLVHRVYPEVQARARRSMQAILAKHGNPLPRKAGDAAQVREWQAMRQRMLSAGRSPAEVDGVLRSARDVFAAKGMGGVLAIPVYVEPEWAEGHRVWVLGFGWGSGVFIPGCWEAPGHHHALVIDARPPYAVLAQMGCG